MSRAIVLPEHISELSPRRLNAFKAFLAQSGAEIFSSRHDPWLVLRFRTGAGTVTLHRNRRGWLTARGAFAEPWRAFAANLPFRAVPRAGEIKNERDELVAALIVRDGQRCFYCGRIIPSGLTTIEHLVPAAHGGPHHLSNLFLAHRDCNAAAGILSGPEKIAHRDSETRSAAIIDRALAQERAADG